MEINSEDARGVIVTITDLVKYGAIGVALATMVMAFIFNVVLLWSAKTMADGKLSKVISHASSTQKLSIGCLAAAVMLQAVGLFFNQRPIDMSINLYPEGLYSDAALMEELGNGKAPIIIKLANERIPMESGSQTVLVRPDSTMSLDLYNIIENIKYRDQLENGNRLIVKDEAGLSSPSFSRRVK